MDSGFIDFTAPIFFFGNSTVTALDSGPSGIISYTTPVFFSITSSFSFNSMLLVLFLITLTVSFISPRVTLLCKTPVRFLNIKPDLSFFISPGNHTLASPSRYMGLDFQPIENLISLDIDSLNSTISDVQDQRNLKVVLTPLRSKLHSKGSIHLPMYIQEFLYSGFSTKAQEAHFVENWFLKSFWINLTQHSGKTNTFSTWFPDDYLSLSRCNDYQKKINSLEGSGFVLIFADCGYMSVKRCREIKTQVNLTTREIDSSSVGKGKLTEENLENRIAEQPRKFSFKEVKLGSFGTRSRKTPKIQTAAVGTGNHKRDFKVKSLKAAHTARLLEQQKETLRRLRKEAYQIELAKIRKENEIKMQGNFIKKMEELKKKQERRLVVAERVRKQKLKNDSKHDENLKGTSIPPPYKYSPTWNKNVPSWASEDHVAMVLPMKHKTNPELIFCANSFCTMDGGNHKRDFKMKPLKAAQAARLREQEKENLRRQRKKAYQIEIANIKKENVIKMQGKFIKKMEELKKKQERRLLVAAEVQKQKLKKDSKHDANLKGTSIPPPYEYPPIRKKSVPSWASVDRLTMVLPLQQKINPESIFCPNSFCTVDEVLLPWESKNHAYDDDDD